MCKKNYKIINSVDKKHVKKKKKEVPVTIIGEVISNKGIWLEDHLLELFGFDHFGDLG